MNGLREWLMSVSPPLIAGVALDVNVDIVFDYHVPPALDALLTVGQLVQVGFRTTLEVGIIVSLERRPDDGRTLKPILDLLDAQPVVTPHQIAIARWMAHAYRAPLGACVWLWLPAGMTGRRDIAVSVADSTPVGNASPGDLTPEPDSPMLRGLTATQQELVTLLRLRGTLRTKQLNAALGGQHWRGAVDKLAAAGIVNKTPLLAPPRARARMVQTAALAIPPHEIETRIHTIARPSRPADLLAAIADGITERRAALSAADATNAHLEKLIAAGYVVLDNDKLGLAIPPAEIPAVLNALRKLEKPLHILRILAREQDANAGKPLEVSWIYAQADATLGDLKRLEAGGLIALGEKQMWRDPIRQADAASRADATLTDALNIPPPLTPAQDAAWSAIRAAILTRAAPSAGVSMGDVPTGGGDAAWTFLLHGVTGSGKTEVYLRAIELTLGLGRQAIYLVPEIALTPQTIARVNARFPGRVIVLHNRISDGERYDAWTRARDGLASVVVGARSALFAPFPDVGLIILDEEHDHSYKQSPGFQQPYYDARRAAEQIARHARAVVILGSATPDIQTRYRAERGAITRLALPHRVAIPAAGAPMLPDVHGDLPPVQIVDMRAELHAGNTSIFSTALHEGVRAALEHGEQALLFLNRRGQATYVFCRECGYVAACPRCETPLTHHYDGVLRCHHCGYHQPELVQCPICHSRKIKHFGAGVQQVESTLKATLPAARVLRWDADTASGTHAHEQIMARFVKHEADILIGTQMISKGIDIPRVTFVGIINADVGLTLPDFRASERGFQVMTQVAGRAGRGSRAGRVVLQTYMPDHYAIIHAARHDYDGFYQRELAYRKTMGYPPYRRMARLLFRATQVDRARGDAERTAAALHAHIERQHLTGSSVIGAAPCFFEKIDNHYRWHVLLRSPDPVAALRHFEIAPHCIIDIDPNDIL
jgi:primosomal protein N' (replication factor Y)